MEMRLSEEIFFGSTLRKVLFLIGEYFESRASAQGEPTVPPVREVQSMWQLSRMAQAMAGGE